MIPDLGLFVVLHRQSRTVQHRTAPAFSPALVGFEYNSTSVGSTTSLPTKFQPQDITLTHAGTFRGCYAGGIFICACLRGVSGREIPSCEERFLWCSGMPRSTVIYCMIRD